MIYAIRAVGTQYVKIGKANSVGKRLKELETGSPHELHIEAVANWPDDEERRLHRYLEPCFARREWFVDGPELAKVITLMQDPDGLYAWQALSGEIRPEPLTKALPTKEQRRQEREVWWKKNRPKRSPQQSVSPVSQQQNSPQSSTEPSKAMVKANQFIESLLAWESNTLRSIANSLSTEKTNGETLRSQEL